MTKYRIEQLRSLSSGYPLQTCLFPFLKLYTIHVLYYGLVTNLELLNGYSSPSNSKPITFLNLHTKYYIVLSVSLLVSFSSILIFLFVHLVHYVVLSLSVCLLFSLICSQIWQFPFIFFLTRALGGKSLIKLFAFFRTCLIFLFDMLWMRKCVAWFVCSWSGGKEKLTHL